MRPFITLIYVFVEYNNAVKGRVRPSSGYVTVETWACALSGQGGGQTAKSLCTELHAARMILIPVLVLGFVHLVLVIRIRVVGLRGQVSDRKSGSVDSGMKSTTKGVDV